jgi:putative aldouronate transport system permease protein
MAKKHDASSTLIQSSDASQLIIRDLPGDRRISSHSAPHYKKSLGSSIWRARWAYLLILPGATYFLIFYYLPLLGNVVAFQDYSPYLGFFRSAWVGLDNFTTLLTDPEFFISVRNTLVISVLQIIFAFPLGLVLALMLNAIISVRFKRAMQSIVYLPHFMGWVIIASIWREIFGGDGFVNHLITGLGGKPIDLITNPALFQPMMVLQVIWKESGWSTVMFLAALSTIDLNLYEAAVVDGASKWRRMWHITLPGLRTIIALLLILRLGSVLSVGFEQIFLQQQGVNSSVSQVIDTFVYSRGIVNGQWGIATAAGLIKAAVGVVLIYLSNKIAKKLGGEGLF